LGSKVKSVLFIGSKYTIVQRYNEIKKRELFEYLFKKLTVRFTDIYKKNHKDLHWKAYPDKGHVIDATVVRSNSDHLAMICDTPSRSVPKTHCLAVFSTLFKVFSCAICPG